ncbi:hypothetical protein ACWE42_20595 [Sutcliffiella cohnii]
MTTFTIKEMRQEVITPAYLWLPSLILVIGYIAGAIYLVESLNNFYATILVIGTYLFSLYI